MAAYATTTTIDRQNRPRRTRRRAVTLAVGAVAAATAVGGVGAGAHATTAGSGGEGNFADGGTFTYVSDSDPGNLDPHMSVFVATNRVNTFAYDTLVNLGPDGTILPRLAASWEETPTSITYTLNDGITCADGTPLTATTVGDNFSFVADPANQSPLLGVQVPAGITVEADDAAGTVTLTSPQPVPFFLQSTGAGLFIVCAKGLADRSILASGTDGTGPFVLTDAVPNDHYSFTAPRRVRVGARWRHHRRARLPGRRRGADRHERVDRRQPAARPVRSTRPRSPGRIVNASRTRATSASRTAPSSASSSSTRWPTCRPPTSPCARP